MHLEVDIQSIEVLSVYITNKASIFSVMMDFLVWGPESRECVDNDTTDYGSDYQIHNQHISQIVASCPRWRHIGFPHRECHESII